MLSATRRASAPILNPDTFDQLPWLNARRVAELREALVEEGRRRRLLYEERRWAAQSELRRVLAEKMAVEEKDGMLRLLLAVGLCCRRLIVSSFYPFRTTWS